MALALAVLMSIKM